MHPKYSFGGAQYSSSAAQFDTALEIAIAYRSSWVWRGSLSLAECTNTKTQKKLISQLAIEMKAMKNSQLSPHIGVLSYPSQREIYLAT